MLRKLPIIGVFGQGAPLGAGQESLALAAGGLVAGLGAHILTGGGYGVMEAAARGFVAAPGRAGLSIGIVPRLPDGSFDEPNRGPDGAPYPNPYVEVTVMTPLPPRTEDWMHAPSRNHVNVLTADAILALPGGAGTDNELAMAAFYRRQDALLPEQRHTVLLGPREKFSSDHLANFVHATTLEEASHHLISVLRLAGFVMKHG